MSTLPDFTGPGYFAGEAPEGLTTVAGVPVAADVRVYWRDHADPQAPDVLVASTQSAADGTWRITNLNPDLQYVVRGRKNGFDDVSVVGAVPTRTDVVVATGSFATNADKNGVDGMVLIEGGLPPYTVTQVQPLPLGLEPVITGHELRIEGASDDAGRWQSMLRVSASNGALVDVPVSVHIAWTPASLVVPPKIWLDDSSEMELASGVVASWKSKGSIGAAFAQANASRRPSVVSDSHLGRQIVRFDGVDDCLLAPASALSMFRAVGAAWLFALYKKRGADSAPKERLLLYASGASSPNRFTVGIGGNSSLQENTPYLATRRVESASTAGLRAPQQSHGVWSLLSAKMHWSSGQASLQINGSVVASNTSLTTAGNTPNTNSQEIGVGGTNGGWPDMDLAVMIVGAGSMPDAAEFARLEGWAAHRYGVTDLLPADHPYKTEVP